jgi:hypothetical protein
MSPKARIVATRPDFQVATEAKLDTIRRRLAEGFYDRPEIRDRVVEAVRNAVTGSPREA